MFQTTNQCHVALEHLCTPKRADRLVAAMIKIDPQPRVEGSLSQDQQGLKAKKNVTPLEKNYTAMGNQNKNQNNLVNFA